MEFTNIKKIDKYEVLTCSFEISTKSEKLSDVFINSSIKINGISGFRIVSMPQSLSNREMCVIHVEKWTLLK